MIKCHKSLVDGYRAGKHLAEATRLFKGEDTSASALWCNSLGTALYQGHADRIAGELEQATPAKSEWGDDFRREADYFRQQGTRMNYLEMSVEHLRPHTVCHPQWTL